jgi:cytochrome P450
VEEIATVSNGKPITAEHIPRLAYTRQVFSEAMRLYPPAPIITRTALNDFKLGEFLIPAGTAMFVPIYAVHRHASIWPQPEVFDPERFSQEAAKERHRFAYMPFGAGPRVCIGSGFALMEAVTILAVLLQKVRLSNTTNEPPEPMMKVTLRPKRQLLMKLDVR